MAVSNQQSGSILVSRGTYGGVDMREHMGEAKSEPDRSLGCICIRGLSH